MKEIIQKFLAGQKILLESAAPLPWEFLRGHSLIIAYASHRERDKLLEETAAAGISACVLKEPALYLSPEKLEAKLAAPSLAIHETPFLLKMALWSEETVTGDREELSLEREEYGLFDSVSDEDGGGKFWKQALQRAAESEVVLVHQYALALGFESAPELLHGPSTSGKAPRSLIILEAARLENSLTEALRKKFTESRFRPFFGEKATLVFGFLGIFYEKFSPLDAGGYRGNAVLDEELRQSNEWQRFVSAIENLPDHPKKNELLEFLQPRENWIVWVSSFANEVALHAAPIDLEDSFQESVRNFSGVLLQSAALSDSGNFALTKALFSLDEAWEEERGQPKKDGGLNIIIPDNFPEPFSGGYFRRCQKLFLELMEKEKGGCLFLVSSKKAAAAFYQSMISEIPASMRLLAVGPTGGVGKSIALFLEHPETSSLIITDQVLPHLQEIEDHIKAVVFQKIPFDPPFDPLLSARAKRFVNGFNEYTLPRAIMRFREVLAELGKGSANSKTCYILDSRLKTRAYGSFFVR